MHSDCRQIAHRLLVLYSFLHVNFSHSLQGLLEIGLAFSHGLQFPGKHFWQAEWQKSGLHYTISRKKKPPQRRTNTAISLMWILISDVQMGRSVPVSESASDWQCLIYLHILFLYNDSDRIRLTTVSEQQWEAEWRRGRRVKELELADHTALWETANMPVKPQRLW